MESDNHLVESAGQSQKLKKLYELSMMLSGDPVEVFKRVAQMIGELFDVRTVCLSEVRGTELHFISVYMNGDVIENAGQCALSITPCSTVEESSEIQTYDKVSERFPQASFLREHNAFSYCGFPALSADGSVVAVTCLLDDKPHTFTEEDKDVLRIFGQRIAAEIERKNTESRLDESQERLRAIGEALPDVLFLIDEDGRCLEVFSGARDLLCADSSELLGNTLDQMFPRDEAEKILGLVLKTIETGESQSIEYNLPIKGEELFFEGRTAPLGVTTNDRRATIFVTRDVTERKHLEERIRRSQKMEAIGQLTGGVAHDFNNLLAVMVGNIELIELLVGQDSGVSAYLADLMNAADRGAALTQRLLAFARQQPLSARPRNLNNLVEELSDMIQRSLGETIDLKTALAKGLWPANVDGAQLDNALLNLALNARDSMPQGGCLTIQTANATLDEACVDQNEDVEPGNYVEIAVSDSGHGMASEVLEKAFEPFFTTKELGNGLGLSMVYGFVKQSNGHISINSKVDHGTTVKMYFPRAEGPVTKPAVEEAGPSIECGSECILVVEDDESVRRLPVRILQAHGYQVVEATDGRGAIMQLEGDQSFDLLFTDIVLPGGMSGLDIAKEAKRLQPNIKVLYTSGYSENSVTHQGQIKPGETLINKPYRRMELLERVRAVLAAR